MTLSPTRAPTQRLLKNPIKSFALSEAQYDHVRETHPDHVITEGENAVIGVPYRDFLIVHYSFTDLEVFRQRFPELFDACTRASSRDEAPRGVVLPFRDRVNRGWSEKTFWGVMLEDGPEWVEMSLVAIPQQDEPADQLEGGFSLREATAADRAAVSGIEAAALELPPLTEAGMQSLADNSACLRLVLDGAGAPVGYVSLSTFGGGWGVIEEMVLQPAVRAQLVKPVIDWSVAWLRSHGGRRVRQETQLNDDVLLPALRNAGFTPGETGIVYTRPVDPADVQARIDARKQSGTLIKFGNWR